MNVAVTGAAGFIGTNLFFSDLFKCYNLFGSDIKRPRYNLLNFQIVDLCDTQRCFSWLDEVKPQAIIHLGARTDLRGISIQDYNANTAGVNNICSWLIRNPSCRIALFASSRLVCKIGYQPKYDQDYCPTTAYGESKILGEKIVRDFDLSQRWTIFRPTSIWGPWMSEPYDLFFKMVSSGFYVHPQGIRVYKSFSYIKNFLFQLKFLIKDEESRLNKKTIYLADYEPIEVLTWGNYIRSVQKKRAIQECPLSFLKAAALLGDVLNLQKAIRIPLTTFRLDNLLTPMLYDIQPIQQLLPVLPTTWQQGVEETVTYFKKYG